MNNMYLLLSFQTGTVIVSEGVIAALGRPTLIQLLMKPAQHMFIITSCEDDDPGAIVVPPALVNAQPNPVPYEIDVHSWLRRIQRQMDWKDDTTRIVYGRSVGERNAVVFALDEAQCVSEVSADE